MLRFAQNFPRSIERCFSDLYRCSDFPVADAARDPYSAHRLGGVDEAAQSCLMYMTLGASRHVARSPNEQGSAQ